MRVLQAAPQTSRGFPAVAQADAGAADHRVQLMLEHVLKQRRPQRHDDGARAPVSVHARAPKLQRVMAQAGKRRQVKLGVDVKTARAARGLRREHAIRADQLARSGAIVGNRTHHQVVAKRIETVCIQPRRCACRWAQMGAHFFRKHQVAQALGFTHVLLARGPAHAELSAAMAWHIYIE